MGNREAELRLAVEQTPEDAAAHSDLAAWCYAAGELDEALREYALASELAPDVAEGHYNLAAALNASGDADAALDVIEKAKEQHPDDALIHYGRACILQNLGRLNEALASFALSLELDPDNVGAWYGVGVILLRQGDPRRASTFFDRALDVDPEHADSAYMRDALSGHARRRPEKAFVRELFDSYALSYDEHMRGTLKYRAPELVAEVLVGHLGDATGLHALDLGCGTGLLGNSLQPFADHLVGVDLAPAMLDRARTLDCYDELECGDVLEYLNEQESATLDLVASADLFIYFAGLEEVFAAVRRVLKPNGLFVYTVEEDENEGWSVGPSGRFHHSREYLEALRDKLGFAPASFEHAELRREAGKPCQGFVVAWSV